MGKQLKCRAKAGFAEKNDIIMQIAPGMSNSGIKIQLMSSVQKQYGVHIKQLIAATVTASGYVDVVIEAVDKGAWDYTIVARVLAALERGTKNAQLQGTIAADDDVCAGQ